MGAETFIRVVEVWVPDADGAFGRALARGVPEVGPSAVSGLPTPVALPVLQAGRVAAGVACYS